MHLFFSISYFILAIIAFLLGCKFKKVKDAKTISVLWYILCAFDILEAVVELIKYFK